MYWHSQRHWHNMEFPLAQPMYSKHTSMKVVVMQYSLPILNGGTSEPDFVAPEIRCDKSCNSTRGMILHQMAWGRRQCPFAEPLLAASSYANIDLYNPTAFYSSGASVFSSQEGLIFCGSILLIKIKPTPRQCNYASSNHPSYIWPPWCIVSILCSLQSFRTSDTSYLGHGGSSGRCLGHLQRLLAYT